MEKLTGHVALAGETAGGVRVRLDLFCFILSRIEGLYQDKKEKNKSYNSVK